MERPAHFALSGTVLCAKGDLGMEDEREFEQLIWQLVAAGEDTPCLDLRGVTYMGSTYLGLVVVTAAAVMQRGAQLSVRASPSVYRLLKMAQVESLGNIQLAER
jgi:anti-anti-sigma factor